MKTPTTVQSLYWNSCSSLALARLSSRSLAPESQRQLTKAASAASMNAAALLCIKAELGKLRHKGALTTEQFQLLKARTKDGTVTEELLGLLNQAWALRCDGTLDEGEYAEDIGTVIGEMQPPSRMSSTAAPLHWPHKCNRCHHRLLLLLLSGQEQIGGKTARLRRLPRAR